MKFTFNPSPNMRQKQSTSRIMLELTAALAVVFAFSLFYYNSEYGMEGVLQVVKLLATSLLVTVVTESVWALATKQNVKTFLATSYGWVTAMILTLMCTVNVTPYAIGVATFFAIFIAKLLFGGFGQNIFNPAAIGRGIIFLAFMGASSDVISGATVTTKIATEFNWLAVDSEMINSMMNSVDGLKTLFTGWYTGAIGETSALLLIILGVILAVRKVIDWKVPTVYLASIFVFTSAIALFTGVGSYEGIPGFIWYPLLHLFIGGAVFGAVFMLTDPVTSPTSSSGRMIFAVGAAALTVLIRIKANYPEGVLFSILIMNMLTPMIEQAMDGKQLQMRKKAMTVFAGVAVVGLATNLLAASVIEPAKKPEPKPEPEPVFVSINDEETSAFAAELVSSTDNGDGTTTFLVNADGFKAQVEGDAAALNEFEIVVNTADNTIVSVKVLKCVDTAYVGDQIAEDSFLEQFAGKDLTSEFEVGLDSTSAATYSVRSSVRALQEVRASLGL